MTYLNNNLINRIYTQSIRHILLTLTALFLWPSGAVADHLSDKQCYEYFECVLGQDSAINACYDNEYLKKIGQNRPMCMKIAQHECKVVTGIQGTGRHMTIAGPVTWYDRPVILDQEAGTEVHVEMPADIRIYNYAGWNHCPYKYQGLQDFWCDPDQVRYPPEPWCDVVPIYNIDLPDPETVFMNDSRFQLYRTPPMTTHESHDN